MERDQERKQDRNRYDNSESRMSKSTHWCTALVHGVVCSYAPLASRATSEEHSHGHAVLSGLRNQRHPATCALPSCMPGRAGETAHQKGIMIIILMTGNEFKSKSLESHTAVLQPCLHVTANASYQATAGTFLVGVGTFAGADVGIFLPAVITAGVVGLLLDDNQPNQPLP